MLKKHFDDINNIKNNLNQFHMQCPKCLKDKMLASVYEFIKSNI